MNKEYFGTSKNNKDVFKYTLANNQISVSILSYGGTIQEIYVSDYKGQKDNVVLSYDKLSCYEKHSAYFGAITGRNAGRIAEAQFSLDNTIYQLSANNKSNQLHGGFLGLDKRVWQEVFYDDTTLILHYHSPSGEEGYPGNVDFTATYTIEESTLHWTLEAITDQITPINLCNHTYFNLSGNQYSASEHLLTIKADNIFCIDNNSLIDGTLQNVTGTPFDFREAKKINQDIASNHDQIVKGKGYDHPFLLNTSTNQITLYDSHSKRQLLINTNQPACVFYSGNFLDEHCNTCYPQKNFPNRWGVCLETQLPPNAVHLTEYNQQVFIKPQKPYKQKTSWIFSHL